MADYPQIILPRITSLVFETILFVLTLIKFVDAVKMGWGRRPVMRDFVSDGTWAYTLIFGTGLISIFFNTGTESLRIVTMLINSMLYKLVKSPIAGVCFTSVFAAAFAWVLLMSASLGGSYRFSPLP